MTLVTDHSYDLNLTTDPSVPSSKIRLIEGQINFKSIYSMRQGMIPKPRLRLAAPKGTRICPGNSTEITNDTLGVKNAISFEGITTAPQGSIAKPAYFFRAASQKLSLTRVGSLTTRERSLGPNTRAIPVLPLVGQSAELPDVDNDPKPEEIEPVVRIKQKSLSKVEVKFIKQEDHPEVNRLIVSSHKRASLQHNIRPASPLLPVKRHIFFASHELKKEDPSIRELAISPNSLGLQDKSVTNTENLSQLNRSPSQAASNNKSLNRAFTGQSGGVENSCISSPNSTRKKGILKLQSLDKKKYVKAPVRSNANSHRKVEFSLEQKVYYVPFENRSRNSSPKKPTKVTTLPSNKFINIDDSSVNSSEY